MTQRKTLFLTGLAVASMLAGCGRAASPAAPAVAAAPLAAAPASLASAVVPGAPAAAGITASNTGRLAPTVTKVAGTLKTPAEMEYESPADVPPTLALPAPHLTDLGEDDPPAIAAYVAATDEPPSYKVDDRIPYGVVVAERSAHTATIAWRTEVPTRGIIDYGRAWGYDKNGYTGQFVDDVAKTDHVITVTDLRRWTGYVFKITAVTPLGLKFEEKERRFRTKFWSWR